MRVLFQFTTLSSAICPVDCTDVVQFWNKANVTRSIVMFQGWFAHLSALGVARFLHLVLAFLGESDAEHTEQITIRGLHIDVRLD